MSDIVYLVTVRPSISSPFFPVSLGGTTSPTSLSSSLAFVSQGANRPDGIGFFAIQNLLSQNPKAHIIAAARDPSAAVDLQALVKSSVGRVSVVKMDVADLESVKVSFLFVSCGNEEEGTKRGKLRAHFARLLAFGVVRRRIDDQASLNEVAALPVVRDHGIDVLFANAGVVAGGMVPSSLM